MPDGITRLDSGIFGYDLNITSISLPAGVALSMWNLRRCPYLESVEFRDGAVIDGCVTRDGVVYSENGLMLSFCPPGRSGTFDIPDGVRWIESSAFSGCGELTSVTIPASVRGMGSYAFESCYGLTSITLPDSLRALPGGAFADCESLEDVAGGQNLFEVGAGAFSGTPFLDEADGLVQVGNVVVGCGAEVDPRVLQIPEGVTAIANGAFSDQGEIASVKLPASLKRIGDYAFSDCGNLAQVTGGENLTEIGAYAFYNCTALTAFDIPAGVKSLCYAVFEDCASLATVTGGAGLEGRVERSAFYSTPFLEETPGAVVLGGCLLQYNGDCPESYSVPAGVTDISDEVFCGQDALATLTLPAGLKSIGLCAFEGCESLTTVVGGADVESIGSGAFAGTPYGEDEELNPGYRVLGRCLWGYTGSCAPSPFVIPDGVFVVGTGDGGGFSFDDGEVSELRIPSSVKRINELGNLAPCAITGGAGLEDVSRWSVDLRNLPEPADGFLRVGSVVVGTSGLDVEALGGRLVIPEGVTAIGAGAFEEQLEEVSHVKLPGSLRRINRDAFAYCWCLESIDLGAAVEEVADWAFYGCWSLTRLTVANPDIRFGANAFYDCFGLDEVAAPVKGGYVFGGWTTDTGRDFGADLAMAFTREEEEEGWGPYAKVFANWIESAEAGAADLPEEATGIPAEAPPPVLFDNPVAGEFDGGDIFTGWLKNASGQIVGTISIKAGKPNKSGVSKLTATIVRIGDKKLTLKGECAIGSGVQAELTGGAGVATIRFGAEGFVGEFGDCTIEGGRNVFAARDEDARARAALFAKWIGVYTVALLPRPVVTGTVSVRGWCGLSVVVGKGGKAKVSGTMPDGQKVSASVQLIAGDHGAACVPVLAQLYSGKKGGFAFLLWLQDDGIRVTNANEWDATGSKVPFKAEWDEIRAGRPGTVRTDAVFAVDAASASLPMGAVRSDLLPVAEALVADDRRWKTAEKPSRVDKEGVAAGGNPSALKVSYTAKQGAFKGSFKAFYDDRATGKLKSESATVTGVVVEGVGYGTANLKKNGAWPVEVR